MNLTHLKQEPPPTTSSSALNFVLHHPTSLEARIPTEAMMMNLGWPPKPFETYQYIGSLIKAIKGNAKNPRGLPRNMDLVGTRSKEARADERQASAPLEPAAATLSTHLKAGSCMKL